MDSIPQPTPPRQNECRLHPPARRNFGDDTASRAGRVSFNPLRHVDPFGTVLLPAILLMFRSPFLFGYAKPVPVKLSARLRNPRRDMVWVAAAGPGMNLIIAAVAALRILRRCPASPERRSVVHCQSHQRHHYQRHSRRVQHDPASPAGWLAALRLVFCPGRSRSRLPRWSPMA